MNTKLNGLGVLAVLLALVVVSAGALAAVTLAAPGGTDSASHEAPDCGGLRLDEFYACHFGGWQPTAQPDTAAGVDCDALHLDKYYACLASRWQVTPDDPAVAQ